MNWFPGRIQPRFTDLDPQGHVNNVVVVDYLQQARAQFLLSGPAAGLLDSGCLVVGHQVEYLAPIGWSAEPVAVELHVDRLGAARFVIAYRIRQRGRICVRARTTLCPFDFDRSGPRRLTGVERDFLASWLVPEPSIRELRAPRLAGRGVPYRMQTRWSDQDRYGHINNVRHLDYVMAARIHTTASADPSMTRMGAGGVQDRQWLIARQDIDYLAQMEFRTRPHLVLTAPTRLGTSSVVLASEITDEDATVYARARAVLVCADARGRKQPLPYPARTALAAILVDDPL